MATVVKLRDTKYRGRIPVAAGHTLYGIVDETGYLQEGQVYVVTENSPEGGRRTLVMNSIAVTRSPALHPGDVQLVDAVDVPLDSPLRALSNVIVFSQHGDQDLPSQLSGGDLDGDQFHVIFDRNLIPTSTHKAAEYPRVPAIELGRPVTRKDMSDFFVTFCETDILGMIRNLHLQLSEQSEYGTLDPRCTKLAGLASTAVDSSKTGIFVALSKLPKYDRCRPDFMAPSPRVFVSPNGQLHLEDEETEEDPAFEDLDTEQKPYRYYESKKVLGQLYRAIDEQQFLERMHQDRQVITSGTEHELLQIFLQYMKRMSERYGLLYSHHENLARDIRASYEESLLSILYIYAPTPTSPVSEHEAFAGPILGRKGGAQNKPLRELGKTMRERFTAIVEYTVLRITKGDEQVQGANDLDLLYDDNLDRELETLPRAMAALQVAVEEQGRRDRQLAELQSFKYIAAGVCLREFEQYCLTTLGTYALPSMQ